MTILAISVSIWIVIYLFIGWQVSKFAVNSRLLYTFGWLFLPAIANFFHEEPEFYGVEGFCSCTRRDYRDVGAKYCSYCGGKIKDKLWKRSRK